MLTRQHRFHGHNSLRFVYANGQTLRGQHISLKYLRRTNGRPYRVAVVVSRKVSKSAVVRNRIRRRIYEAVRTSAEENVMPGTDMVFTVYSDQLADLPVGQLKTVIADLLDKTSTP